MAQAEGFLLLTLPNANLTSAFARETGTLCVESVTLQQVEIAVAQTPKSPTSHGSTTIQQDDAGTLGHGSDVWLVLRLNSFEMAIVPNQPILHKRQTHEFIFPPAFDSYHSESQVVITLPTPSTETERADLEEFEEILGQYATLQEVGNLEGDYHCTGHVIDMDGGDHRSVMTLPEYTPIAPTDLQNQDLRGRLVLVDEDSGRVVGTLGDEFNMREDESMRVHGREQEPVVVDLDDISSSSKGEGKREIWVHSIPLEQQDWIMKSASAVRRVFASLFPSYSSLTRFCFLVLSSAPPFIAVASHLRQTNSQTA